MSSWLKFDLVAAYLNTLPKKKAINDSLLCKHRIFLQAYFIYNFFNIISGWPLTPEK